MSHLVVRASLGDAEVLIGVQAPYSPDLLDDMARRVTDVMRDLTGDVPRDNGEQAILAALMGGTDGARD